MRFRDILLKIAFFAFLFSCNTSFAGGGETKISPSSGISENLIRILKDSTDKDTLRFPLKRDRDNALIRPDRDSLDLENPFRKKDSLWYDPITHQYRLQQKYGVPPFRNYTPYSLQEYSKLNNIQQENDYWTKKRNVFTDFNLHKERPDLYYGPNLFNRLFGGTKAAIDPQGSVGITLGYERQTINNPILPERARRPPGGLDFDMDIDMNIQGDIGSKLKLTSTYNTKSTFDFDKQIKLEYTGDANSIVQKVEAGNVSFPLRSQLITGIQSLFGVKARLKFGKLYVTGVFSTQKSKKKNIVLEGGVETRPFDIQADQYEQNQHFFLGQFFRDQFNTAMSTLPHINSQIHITRMQVWITNKRRSTVETRDVVGLMDLGERTPYSDQISSLTSSPYTQNAANDEYRKVTSAPGARNPGTVISRLQALGLKPVQDFEKTHAIKLDSTEYSYNEQLGFISLNRTLQPDEVLAVAYQYTYNGQSYQVGEFANDVPPSGEIAQPQVLFLKLLKATSARPSLPIWKLMMKNIYSLGNSQINRDGFLLDIFYQDPGGGEKRYLPDATGNYEGRTLISILSLDRLNSQNDPQPDGIFDFVDGYTIDSRRGKIIFPVLEPFSSALSKAFGDDPELTSKYEYPMLYDSTITIARQFPQFNRFVIRGSYKSKSSSEISLGGFNIPEGSVTITAGGQTLIENVDYTINYSLGSVRITNDAILSSGLPVNVRFEDNATFGQQTRNYFGLRMDYAVNNKLTLGASAIRMTEKPYFNIVDYNQDPIANTIAGFDANYRSGLPGLTKWLDKLPNYKTTAPSSITATGEVAKLMPGHSKLIGKGSKGMIYLDDFEGASNSFDLRYPFNSWHLASTPLDATNENGQVLFPEASLHDSLEYGFKRAQIAWYTIEPELVDGGRRTPKNLLSNPASRLGHYVRLVKQQEVFPQKSVDFGQSYLNTLDLAYYPKERGSYNFVTSPSKINKDGIMTNPKENWGGVMRALDNTDFEASNVEYIEFWVMDPFLNRATSNDGYLYINLGNVSEDILKDGQMAFENGLPRPDQLQSRTDTSVWGRTPRFQEQITNAFDNDPVVRAQQDVGYDGMNSEQEKDFHRAYMQTLAQAFGTSSAIYKKALADPSNDDFHYYRGEDLDEEEAGVLERYKKFNNPEGNSPVSTTSTSTAASNVPETEDINQDNTLNETEEYFQYRIPLKQAMEVGDNFIVDKMVVPANDKDGPLTPETWYQFRIPISDWDKKVGSISDFKSIRFMRMFLTGFQDSVVMRFAKLGLVRNQWRTYLYDLDTSGIQIPVNPAQDGEISVSSVNVEENGTRSPIPYVIPPGIERQSMLTENNVNRFLNEQSLSLEIKNLRKGRTRAVFKEMGVDLRKFGRIQMFIHAEAPDGQSSYQLKDGEIQAIIRIGSDFVNNYYEYRIPLKVTDPMGNLDPNTIWPLENQLDVRLDIFPKLKIQRNQSGAPVSKPYTIRDEKGNYVTVVGNPSMGDAREFLLGILNPDENQTDQPIDGLSKSATVWFDELRVSDLDENGGYAATGQVDLRLADLGSINVAGAIHTAGFGNIDQRLNDRFKDDYYQYDISANLELGKLLPENWRLTIPIYAGYSQTISNPEYDPYDLDIKLKDKLSLAKSKRERDSILLQAQDFTSITSLNFTNVGMMPDPHSPTNRFWAFSNFRFNYSFSRTINHNPLIENDVVTRNRVGIQYLFNGKNKFIAPLRNLFGSSPYLSLIRDLNFNPIPSLVSIRTELDKQFGETNVRNIGGGIFKIAPTFDKYFSFDRYYNLHWDLTQSINMDFQAVNNSRVDEPYGIIDTKPKRDTLWRNLLEFGRPTFFQQNASLSYNLPLQKFPLLNWVNINLNLTGNYNWTTASLLTPYLGNIIENGNQKQINANLDFNQLYRKLKFLQSIVTPAGRNPNSKDSKAEQENNRSFLKALLTPALMIRRINFRYTDRSLTSLPGYLNSIGFMGQDWKAGKPGWKFALGWQPDEFWLNRIGEEGWLTSDSSFNIQYRQQYIQQFDLQGTLQPLPDLVIDLSMHKSFSKNHSELFKDLNNNGIFQHLNPYDAGGFEVSYFSLKTLFDKVDKETGTSSTYHKFEQNRAIISERLGNLNPYTDGAADPKDPGYALGYGRYANDVLIPAFLAAYSGKDPKTSALIGDKNDPDIRQNPFKSIKPFPNWSIKYNGLSKIPALRGFINNLTISNSYTSTLSMNSFSSNLFFSDPLGLGFPGFIDSTSGNYIPYYMVPNITISEQLSPLIGFDASFTNDLSVSVSYGKSRTLTLSLIDYQITEVNSTRYTVGAGFRVRNFPLPFNIGSAKKLNNDLNFRFDMSYQNNTTVNNRIDADMVIPTSGTKVIMLSPSIDYVVNNRLNLHFFYNKRATTPFISTSYPMTNTEAGITFRFILQ